jgi:pSer/pThr/pTyr-binding forkhead associated (FHA) protein
MKEDAMADAQYRLVVRQGPNPGQVFELDKDVISIGRDITNDIVLTDAEVSRKHAQLTLDQGRYKIEDLNSTNGTYIDGQRLIGPHVLAVGEIIMFGDNIGVVFEGESARIDETVPSWVEQGATPVAAIPVPAEKPAQPAQPAQSVQSPMPQIGNTPLPHQALPAIEQEPVDEATAKPVNSWLLAGCGCLLVIVVLFIAVWVFIDQPWNPVGLYCVSPFDIIFKSLGYCP